MFDDLVYAPVRKECDWSEGQFLHRGNLVPYLTQILPYGVASLVLVSGT